MRAIASRRYALLSLSVCWVATALMSLEMLVKLAEAWAGTLDVSACL